MAEESALGSGSGGRGVRALPLRLRQGGAVGGSVWMLAGPAPPLTRRILPALAAIALALAAGGCSVPAGPAGANPGVALGPRTRSHGCHVDGLLPDRACTPGSVIAWATVKRICTPGYARSVRDVPQAVKWQVYAAYGVYWHPPGSYEVDHLVPLELGGGNGVANLWPEAAPGYHEKDAIENALHRAVCDGRVSLRAAQRQIAEDWRHTQAGPPSTAASG